MTDGLDGFVPLMLQPGWILERYHGWTVVEDVPGIKLLRRPRGPLRSFLMMTRGAAWAQVEATARRSGALGALSRLNWIDLAPAPGEVAPPDVLELAHRRCARVASGRIFGVGTFVIDLGEDDEVLWRRVAPRARGQARQAQRAGVRATSGDVRRVEDCADLLRLYAPMARERGLEPLDRSRLARMASDGRLLLARAEDATGATIVANVAWVEHGQGYFLHGARAPVAPAGAGLLAQWEAVRALKAHGCAYYDLGLVASRDESDGLYRFKRSLGGRFVSYGEEYCCLPSWLRAPLGAFRRLRVLARRSRHLDA